MSDIKYQSTKYNNYRTQNSENIEQKNTYNRISRIRLRMLLCFAGVVMFIRKSLLSRAKALVSLLVYCLCFISWLYDLEIEN